jgi:Ca-activated chloride channel family protein
LFGWVVAVVLAATLTADQQDDSRRVPSPDATAGTFKSAVDLVTLNVTVTDGRNRTVPGLGRDDFQVLEDGIAQDLSFFAASEVPLDVALLVDASSSIIDKMPLVQQAAEGFIDTLRSFDRAALMTFTTQLRVLQPFTSDRGALKTALHSVAPRGNTALYTALYVTLDHFERLRRQQSSQAGVRRPAIVVLTDGEDTASVIQFDDLLDRARRAGIAIYPIMMTGGDVDPTVAGSAAQRRFYNRSDYAIKALAQETGARAFFPVQGTDLNAVYQLVAEELSSQYALGYVPKVDRRDGSYRRLSVRIAGHPDARPRTRAGYYSAGPVRVAR